MKILRPVYFAWLFCIGLGCVHRPPSPSEALVNADKAAGAEGASARTLALAGFHAFLIRADAPMAQTRFDAALNLDAHEPYALYGQLLLARRRSQPASALQAALNLCERAPAHPLASAGARFVLDMVGASSALDDEIVKRSQAILARGAPGDTAQLLRSAIANIQGQRGGVELQSPTLKQMGVARDFSVWGPFFSHHVLSFDTPTPPERDGSLAPSFRGPYGKIEPRTLSFGDGRFNLSGEYPEGDGYLFATDFSIGQPGVYAVRAVTSGSYKLYLDGALLYQTRLFEHTAPAVSAEAVQLQPGGHRIIARVLKEERVTFSISVMRLDGQPANLTFLPAQGPAPQWKGVVQAPRTYSYPTAQSFADALRPEAGELLSQYIAIRDGMGRDPEGAKALMGHLSQTLSGPALSSLRAELNLGDRTVPPKVARGRATRDLEAALDKDPKDVNALLVRAAIVLEDGRPLEAAEFIKQARGATSAPGYPISLMESRVQLALGVDAQAEQSALQALKLQAGLCEALSLRYELARRRDAIALSDELEKALRVCPGHFSRSAEHARLRGDFKTAAALYQQEAQADWGQLQIAHRQVELALSQKQFDEAEKILKRLSRIWPRNPNIYKRLADVQEYAGKPEAALAMREQALALDGSDLTLRRSVERARSGKELLADYAVDGKAAIAAYEAEHAVEDSSSTYVLDAAAIRAYPDGSMVDRIHTIQKALDPSGTSQIAEVNIPPGAQVLTLRTIKADGTVLEPEGIEGKETLSLPGVSVGDYVEQEFLLSHPGRGPALPGFTAANFYYQIAREPNHWSTYTVVAPKGTGMKVDAHNVASEQPKTRGDEEVFFHQERRVPPYIPEPESPPSPNEYLPFVSVGAGAQGEDGLIAAFGDAFVDRGQRTFEIDQFAHAAVAGKTGLEAVSALYSAVMDRLSGRDAGVNFSAAFSLAQNRGSRLWLLKASLEAVGIPTRLVAIRAFGTDPAQYKFPSEGLLPYLCLRAEIPNGTPVWLDPTVRFGPFGVLPEQATGNRESWLLPEPGRPLQRLASPPAAAGPSKEVQLDLALSDDGTLTGKGVETYQGMEAAKLTDALESMSEDQRNQALQSALSRYFGGAELSNVSLDLKHQVGAPLALKYAFSASHFARVEGDKMLLGTLTFPAQLGKRYVQLGSRRTPLFIDETEYTHTQVSLVLPPGFEPPAIVPEIKSNSRFGMLARHESRTGGVLKLDEVYRLDMARVPPALYDDFTQFAGEVDLIQSRDFSLDRKKAPPAPRGPAAERRQ